MSDLLTLKQQKQQLQGQIKRMQGKINSLQRQMLPLMLQEAVADLPFKVGDIIELLGHHKKTGNIWFPVRVTGLWLYSFEQPALGLNYRIEDPKLKKYYTCDLGTIYVHSGYGRKFRLPSDEGRVDALPTL